MCVCACVCVEGWSYSVFEGNSLLCKRTPLCPDRRTLTAAHLFHYMCTEKCTCTCTHTHIATCTHTGTHTHSHIPGRPVRAGPSSDCRSVSEPGESSPNACRHTPSLTDAAILSYEHGGSESTRMRISTNGSQR